MKKAHGVTIFRFEKNGFGPFRRGDSEENVGKIKQSLDYANVIDRHHTMPTMDTEFMGAFLADRITDLVYNSMQDFLCAYN